MKINFSKPNKPLRIGVYGISGQSGKAYLADLLGAQGVSVYGYARPSDKGEETVEAIRKQGGLFLQRPSNPIEPESRFIPLRHNEVGHDLDRLVETSDIILFTHPSVYHEPTAEMMKEGLSRRRVPLVLSPSRTLATPYLWQMLGEQYPILALQTCPYSCKSYEPGTTYIKRRKKNWIGSVEGDFPMHLQCAFKEVFPSVIYSTVPATTSLGNIGAIFHPTPYVLNWEEIQAAAARKEHYSFYVQGIANNPVGAIVEEIDQIRLHMAQAVGCKVAGLHADPQEEHFVSVLRKIQMIEQADNQDAKALRQKRAMYLDSISDMVVSSQLWLAYSYGVERIPGESLPKAISRTPHFQERSYPQQRYADEDIPTGLVPLESLAKRLQIPHEPISRVIDRYEQITGQDFRASGRNLAPFDTRELLHYLRGERTAESRKLYRVAAC